MQGRYGALRIVAVLYWALLCLAPKPLGSSCLSNVVAPTMGRSDITHKVPVGLFEMRTSLLCVSRPVTRQVEEKKNYLV
ncbi:hypothetical protein F5Y05DRAFT_382941 [Hypoxylon sp. FL0543]|nr:hypothetical protein F5Y05DRAFT_382941 [Hypoxylon sp. FL0543]